MSVYCLQFDCRMKDCPKHPDKAKTDREARHRDFENNVNVCIKPDFLFAQQAAESAKKKAALPVPTEDEEQEALFQWAETMEYKYPELRALFHITNEGKRSKQTGAKLKREGLREGVSDIELPVKRGQYGSLFIELKKRKGGRVSDEQKEWIDLMWELGNAAYICYGWEEAVKVIEEYLKLS